MRVVAHVALAEVPGVAVLVSSAGPQLALARVSVTEILGLAVSVIITLAGVVREVTDWGGVLAVEVTVVTTWYDVSVMVKIR